MSFLSKPAERGVDDGSIDWAASFMLASSDGSSTGFVVPKDAARLSPFLTALLDDSSGGKAVVPVKSLAHATVQNCAWYLTHFAQPDAEPPRAPELPRPYQEDAEFSPRLLTAFEVHFATTLFPAVGERDLRVLTGLLAAAHLLQLQPLVDLTACAVTVHLRGKTPDEMKDLMHGQAPERAADAPAATEAHGEMSGTAAGAGATAALDAEAVAALSERWGREPGSAAAVAYAVDHSSVSQVLRPELAAFLQKFSVAVRTHEDERRCVDTATFEVEDGPLTTADVEYLEQFPHLVSLSVQRTDIDATGLALLSKLSALRSLNLCKCRDVDAAGLAQVAKLTQLRSLDVRGCTLSAAGLGEIGRLALLQRLDMSECSGVDAQGLAGVAKLKLTLRHLDLGFTEGVDAAALAEVAKLSQLQHLDLSGCDGVNAAALAGFVTLAQLRHLGLQGCPGVDAPGLGEVAKLTELRTLDVSFCMGVDATGLAAVCSKLTLLDEINLSYCSRVPH